MLQTSLSVLASQIEKLGGDANRLAAYRAGMNAWKRYYGRELLYKSVADLRCAVSRRAGFEGLLQLARHAPCQFFSIGTRKTARSIYQFLEPWLSTSTRERLRGWRKVWMVRPPVGLVRFGSFHRVAPISKVFGYDRGLPIDRYYIESFLERHAADVQGRLLEIGDNSYTIRYGGPRVIKSDVLNVKDGIPASTFVGSLESADHLPADAFDCIILTQTLHLIYDFRAALRNVYRILNPGGVLLATVPGISQIDSGEWAENWYWSFTEQSMNRVFEEDFPGADVTIMANGNVLAAIAFLHGLAVSELRPTELDHKDLQFPVIITIRAVKPVATR